MKDSHARGWARKEYQADVLKYQQGPSECAATCALWIRRQLKDKSIFFDAKRLWRAPESTRKVKFNVTEDFDEKIGTLKIYIREQYLDLATGLNDEQRYITQGSRGPNLQLGKKALEGPKEDRYIAQKTNAYFNSPIGKKGRGVLATFKYTYDGQGIASISYDMEDDEQRQFAHAVAIDCRKPQKVIFFDPEVGQFTFTSYDLFTKWWKICWQERSTNEVNAWTNIRAGGSARIEGMYKNIV